MATVPSASVPTRAAVARAGDTRLWRAALVIGLLLCVAYTAVPPGQSARNVVIYPLTELGAILAILAGIRRYRPAAPQAWLLIAAGLFAYLIGDVLWGVYEVLGRDPWPSVADAFYLAGYPLVAAGLVVGIRHRTPTRDKQAMIDAGIVAVSAALLAWVYIVEPDRAGAGLTPLETLVTVAYPLADVLILAVAARLVIGSSLNVPALRLLVGGLLLFLVADTLYALDVLARVEGSLRFVDTMLLVGVVLIGLAGLHRSMPALTEGTARPPAHEDSPWRLVLLGAVSLVPAAVLIVQAVRGEELYYVAVIVAMVALIGLVTARFLDITSHAHRATRREATLGRYATDLLSAGGREELFALAERAAGDLTGSETARVVEPGSAAHAFVAPVLVQGERVAELVVDAKPSQRRTVHDSLTSVAAQLSLALERERLLATEREAAQALAEQNERLRELDRMKDQFVSIVSHELRTPLTSMVGYLELVLEGEAGELKKEQEEFLRIVDRNCDRLNALVDEILFVARVDAGRFRLAQESVDLTALAEAAVKSVQATAKRKGIEVRLSAQNGLPLWADPTRLSQVLDGLLSNAVKFTPEGGTVRLTVARRGDAAHIEVADTGVGIPADDIGRLFERFFRASTAATIPGTGLGLSIVKEIVEAHDGKISVESEEGAGTTFFVDLPLQAPPEAHAAAGTSTTEVAT